MNEALLHLFYFALGWVAFDWFKGDSHSHGLAL